jgi:hypothetical protein
MQNTNAPAAPALTQIADVTLTPVARTASTAHLWFNRAVLGGIAVQFYTVGLAALGVNGFAAHAVLGWSMILVAGLSFVAAGLSRLTGVRLAIAAAVLALTITQALLALVSKSAFPMIYALHGANAVVLLFLAFRADRLAVRSRKVRQS